jgi:flagellar biosynthetic protein FliR
MTITDAEIATFVQQYFFPFVRVGMMFLVVPVLGSQVVPMRVRLITAILITLLVVPMLPEFPAVDPLSYSGMLILARESLVGALIGFSMQIIFQMFVVAGQYMAMKMGLGFAMMNDPTNGVQTTVIAQFFLILTTLMFVTVNGHLYLISLIVESFTSFPIGSYSLNPEKYYELVKLASWMFSTALVFALPVITSLLFINIAFGVMSRAAPQLNIFAVGFPFTLMCGLALIWIGLNNYFEAFTSASDVGFQFIRELIEAP